MPPCASCGYSLAGVADDSRCPECGLSVAATRRGPLLLHADPDWRAQLHTGATFLIIAPAIAIGTFLLHLLWAGVGILIGADSASSDTAPWLLSIAMIVAAALAMRGWWLMTYDEPDAPVAAHTHALNLTLRITSIAFCGVFGLVWLLESALNWAGAGATAMIIVSASLVPLGLLGLTHLIGAMLYFSRLAARVPSPRMTRDFRRSAWLFAIAGVFEGIDQATGWQPSPRPFAGPGLPALLALPIVLLNLVLKIAALIAPLWYALSALWVWRKLRAIEKSAPRRVEPEDDHHGLATPHTARDPRDESLFPSVRDPRDEGAGPSSPADGG